MLSDTDVVALFDHELHVEITKAREAVREGSARLETLMYELGRRQSEKDMTRKMLKLKREAK